MKIKTLKKHQGGASSWGIKVVRPASLEITDVALIPELQVF